MAGGLIILSAGALAFVGFGCYDIYDRAEQRKRRLAESVDNSR